MNPNFYPRIPRTDRFHEPTHSQPLPRGEHAFVGVLSVPLLGGVRGGFRVPMHAKKRMGAVHEPDRLMPSFCPRYVLGEVETARCAARCAVHAAFSGASIGPDRLM